VLSDSELAEVWHACPDDDHGRIVKLLMLTGQRRGEVGGMRWSELGDLGEGLWRLPAGRTKNGLPHEVPLGPTALAIIKAVKAVRSDDERDPLFGRGRNGFGGFGKGKLDLDATIKAARKKSRAKEQMPEFVVHDLRRSVATGLGNLGIPPHVIEAMLNHISGAKKGVSGVYNRSAYAREVRSAMLLWDDHVKAIVEGGERKIVPFPQQDAQATA
jgi:integrase